MNLSNDTMWISKFELQEKSWFILFLVLLMMQNPLLLWIRSVYTLFEITIGILTGLIASGNIILLYLYTLYSHKHIIPKIESARQAENVTVLGIDYPLNNPMVVFPPIFMPIS